MSKYGERYPNYGFEKHKGYPTKEHYEAIKKFGCLPIHRLSFLKKLEQIKMF
jgi:ribonuclease HII